MVKLIEDATDAKSAVEALARQLFSSEELQFISTYYGKSHLERKNGLEEDDKALIR